MKRMVCVALALLLMLAGLPALAMDGDGHLETNGERGFLYGFSAVDRVMLAGENALYEWRPGETEASRYDYALPELDENEIGTVYPFWAGGQLYAIRLVEEYDEDGGDEVDYRHTALYALTLGDGVAEGEMLGRLDWDDLIKYNGDQTTALFPVQVVDDGTSA